MSSFTEYLKDFDQGHGYQLERACKRTVRKIRQLTSYGRDQRDCGQQEKKNLEERKKELGHGLDAKRGNFFIFSVDYGQEKLSEPKLKQKGFEC